MTIKELKDFFGNKAVEFVPKEAYDLSEDKEFNPKFSLKGIKEIADIPINKPIKYSDDIMIKAIKYGMIFVINYKGETGKSKDSYFAGHERVIYPMVLGYSSKKKVLLRAWHLNGWSVSNRMHINKIWRLFRTDRILSMTFTGSFYRLPPPGYNMNDKGMRGGMIARADFNEIRRNQQMLVNKNKIQNRDEITIGDEKSTFSIISVNDINFTLDLNNINDNSFVNNIKNMAVFKITFLKSIYGNKYIAILGVIGKRGNTVKVMVDKHKNIGVYKVLDSVAGNTLNSLKKIKGNTKFELYTFDKKIQ